MKVDICVNAVCVCVEPEEETNVEERKREREVLRSWNMMERVRLRSDECNDVIGEIYVVFVVLHWHSYPCIYIRSSTITIYCRIEVCMPILLHHSLSSISPIPSISFLSHALQKKHSRQSRGCIFR